MLSKVEAVIHRMNKRLAIYVSGVSLIAVMALLVADASLRTFFAKPILWMIDVGEILLAWIVFAAFAYALITGTHVRMTLVTDRLPSRLRSGCETFGNLTGVVFFVILTIIAVPYFWESFLEKETPMAAVGTPVWLGKLALPIGCILMLVVFLVRLARSLRPEREVIEEEVKGEEGRGF